MIWRVRDREIDISRSSLMGILNVTPDSFSDGGRFVDPESALRRAETMIAEGATIIDVGGESTRPGSLGVGGDEEAARVLPVIRALAASGAAVSIDTSKADVARAAIEAGAVIVNDVTALGDPQMAPLVAETGAGLVLMHRLGVPRIMQHDPKYADVVTEVASFLAKQRSSAEDQGIERSRIVLDPGIGFGKTLDHNLELMTRIADLVALGSPILLGASRKSWIGALTGEHDTDERLPGSLAAAVAARLRGVTLFRVHDVAATRQALAVADALAS